MNGKINLSPFPFLIHFRYLLPIFVTIILASCGMSEANLLAQAKKCQKEALQSRKADAMSKALECYTPIIQNQSVSNKYISEAYSQRALLKFSTENIDEALADAEQAVRLDGNNVSARNLYGSLALEKGNYTGSIEQLTKVIEQDPSLPFVFFYRGKAYAASGDNHKALDDLTESLRRESRDRDALVARAEVFEKLNLNNEAISDYRAALEVLGSKSNDPSMTGKLFSPDEVRIYLAIGRLEEMRGITSQALSTYEDGLKSNPGSLELKREAERLRKKILNSN